MDSGPLVPLNGQILHEIHPPFPIEFNRNTAPGAYPAVLAQDSLLREYVRVLIKSKWVVIASVALDRGHRRDFHPPQHTHLRSGGEHRH